MIGKVVFKKWVRAGFIAMGLGAYSYGVAATPSVTARIDSSRVVVGEVFRLTVEVRDGGGAQVTPSLPKEFEVVGQSSQTSFSFGTGRGAERVSRFVYSVVGTVVGKYQLGPFSVKASSKKIESNVVSIEIADVNAVSGKQPAAKGKSSAQPPSSRDVFLTTTLSKSEVWVGEPFFVTIKFYFRVPVSNSSLLDADFSQFVSFDGKDVSQKESREVVDGVEYNVIEVKKTYSARTSGQFKIPAIKLQTDVASSQKGRQSAEGDDPFDRFNDMFSDSFFQRSERKVVGAPPLALTVRSLPEPKPTGWSGVVGDLTIAAEISKTQLAVGENATLTVRAEGIADLSGMVLPDLGAGDGLKTYADKPALETFRSAQDGMSQRKTFSVGVVPTRPGRLIINERPVFVFNPASGQFEERKIQAFALDVSGVAEAVSGVVASGGGAVPQKAVQQSGSDIFPPKEEWGAVARDERFSWQRVLLWFVFPLILVLVWSVLALRDALLRRSGTNPIISSRKAFGEWKSEHARLKRMSRGASGESLFALEESLARAVRAYVERRLQCHAAAMTVDELKQVLLSKSCSNGVAQDCFELVSVLDVGRYAGGGVRQSPGELLSKAENVVARIEKEVRL